MTNTEPTDSDPYEGGDAEVFRKRLVRLATSEGGWTTLYGEPATKKYWKQTYPHSELHGGGPALIEHISEEQARREFKSWRSL